MSLDIDMKIENNGKTAQGRLSAAEFNKLITAVDSLLEAASGGGTSYSVYVRNNLPSLGFAAQYGEKCMLDFTFISQYRDNFDEPYKSTGELGLCAVMVKNAKYTDFTVVKQMEISSGVSVKQDVQEWLSSGSNNIKITVKGENTEQTTAPVTFIVTLTSLGVSAPNFAWWTAFSSDFAIPMVINGNISKTLHVTVTGTEYSQSYEKSLGTAIYTDTPYNYTIPHPGNTGVYNVSFYLSNSDNTIQTKSVSVNIMCIIAGATSKLMCVNNVAGLLTNWQDNTVFDYAIHDGQSSTTDALFLIAKKGEEVYSSQNNAIVTNTKQTLTYPMEVGTDDDSNFEVIVSATSDGTNLITPLTIAVNNSLGYSATAGAALYINPRTRSNSQSNYKSIVNEVDKSIIPVTWSGINWGNDGWAMDSDGNKILKIFARSNAVIDYQPFAAESARKGKTIEIDYKVDNPADASKDIITIVEGAVGLRVSGDNVSFFSQSRQDSTTQDVPTDNGVRIRLTVVVMPDAYGNAGFNIVCIYINGKKNRQYAYENNDYFKNSGKITLGNDYANLYLYGLRVYDSALTSEAVQKNYINQLATTDEKVAEKTANAVLDAEGINIDFDTAKKMYNVFVIDKPFPNFLNPSGVEGKLYVFYKNTPEGNFEITAIFWEGQGTSSKKYLEWNMRGKLNGTKDAQGNKISSVVTYADGTTETKKVRMFKGVPKANKLTAKKNWASSMQDHKAGCVAAYNDLFKSMGLTNEAMTADPEVRVAVYQEPFIGFSKSVNEEGQDIYNCMGEFTFGPDKGDSACFGYDTDKFPNLISVEGSDNAPLGALFRVPWNTANMYWAYNPDEEAFQYNNTNCWDFDAGELNADETEPISAAKWIEAYNAVYVCSNRIKPFVGTLDELNASVTAYRSSGYEYWVAKAGDANLYNLYYYEAAEGRFIPSDIGNGTINLRRQLTAYLAADLSVFTPDLLNELFISSRSALFRATIPAIFDIDDAIFQHCFVEWAAGTDQRAKNTYPYNFCTDGSKWKWRIDDADTIFPIDNQGQDRKPYYCEMHDSYDNGQPIWNGETSVFWNMLELSCASEVASGMKKMLTAMESLCGQSSGTPYDKVYAFYKKYFLGIKEYFPATLVNADAKRFEIAKIAYNNGTYTNDTDPITQSHGDFFSAETAWVKKRIMYIMSKYGYGLFSANGTDTIIVRAAGDLIDYEITPAFDMYPAIANGTSIVQGKRTKAGKVCKITIDLGGSADQQNAIQAASWLLSIGDWHKKSVSGTMVVRGKRITELILGSKTEAVVISITGLTLSDCGSMQKVLVSNIATLQGTLDLSACMNIREVYADGTNVSQIKLPDGGSLETIEYPANNKYISFKNFPLLTTEGLRIGYCAVNITDFWVENCPMLKPMQLLSAILDAQRPQGAAHAMKHIRCIGFNETYTNSKPLLLLSNLADGSYSGLSSEGLSGQDEYPVLDGTITVNSYYYEEAVALLRKRFEKLDLILTGEAAIYIKDKEAERICLGIWDSNKDGYISKEEAAVQMVVQDGRFKGNTLIESFDEFKYLSLFTSTHSFFSGCTKLKSIEMPANLDIHYRMFLDCTSLQRIVLDSGTTMISGESFHNCSSLKEIDITNITTLENNSFRNCGFEMVELPKGLTTINAESFMECKKLKKVIARCDNLAAYGGNQIFADCPSLKDFIIYQPTPPALGWGCFNRTTECTFYVPDAAVNAYKTASGWSALASRIQPMSSYTGIL